MCMIKTNAQPKTTVMTSVLLYRVVFGSRLVIALVGILLFSFILQPIERAYADEESATSSEVQEAAPEPEPEPEVQAAPEPEPEIVESSEEESTQNDVDETDAPMSESDTPTDGGGDSGVDTESLSDEQAEVVDGNPSEEVSDPDDGIGAIETESDFDQVSDGSADPVGDEPNDLTEPDTEVEVATATPQIDPQASDEGATGSSTEDMPVSTTTSVADSATSSSGAAESDANGGGSGGSAHSQTETATTTTTQPGSENEMDAMASSSATTTIDQVQTVGSSTESAPEVDTSIDQQEPNSSSTPQNTETQQQQEETTTDNTSEADLVDSVVTDTATTTPAASSTTQIVYVTQEALSDLNRYQFGVNECVSVGDGSYYCSEADETASAIVDAGVYAAPDEDGDDEIFYRAGGVETQITHNTLDDGSPHIDAKTHEIVWHRLIESKYQIIHYDFDSQTETQLTDSAGSSMEPAIFGKYIVWQEWVDGNWDIMLFDGSDTTRISESKYHDVAPAIREGFVMWHTLGGDGEKLLSVYELATGAASTLSDPDGGHVENPRFVLVYDTVSDNGDVITKEYDLESGDIRPLSSEPAPLPTKIPEPEPVGEEVALVGVKTNGRDDMTEATDSGSEPVVGDTDSLADVVAATTTGDVVVTPASITVEVDDTPTTTQPVTVITDVDLTSSSTEVAEEITEFDLVVEPYTASSSAQSVDTASTTNNVE